MIDATLAAIPADAAATIERQLAIRTRAVRIIDDEDVMLYGPTNGDPTPPWPCRTGARTSGYDSSGDLVGEYATVQEAVLATR